MAHHLFSEVIMPVEEILEQSVVPVEYQIVQSHHKETMEVCLLAAAVVLQITSTVQLV